MNKIELHNTPEFYKAYIRNWYEKESKRKGANAAELAIIKDLSTLVEVASEVLTPTAKNENNKN